MLVDVALEYALVNAWYVFPCREVEGKSYTDKKGKIKTPSLKSPYHRGGFMAATREPEKIKAWWGENPKAAIGIACGASHLICVDIDVKDGRKGFDNYMRLEIGDAGALHSMTPSGGMHVIFRGQTNSYANVLTGIDLRSVGAYFIAPPSEIFLHGAWSKYSAVDDWTNRIPADVPEELIKKLDLYRKPDIPYERRETTKEYNVSQEEQLKRAKAALDKLSQEYCDEYFKWVNVGLALKSLGEDGLVLWDNWSKKSLKYQADACAYRWDRFYPRDITIASLYYWAKECNKK